ncbi:MAG: hypothetical protein RLY40_1028 [Pseudomonadota bacterium]|jgi:membrane protease YdiL (CAAX protease family)
MNSQFHSLALISYGILYLTVISLWFKKNSNFKTPGILLVLAVILGLLSQILKPIALVPIALLPLVIYSTQIKTASKIIKLFSYVLVILLSLGLLGHNFPGFYNLKILNQVYISKDAIPFSMYLNFDKALVGIFILGMSHQLIFNKEAWENCLKQTIPPLILLILLVMLLAIALGFVHFDPKMSHYLLIWSITNLLFVCVAEEAFFRGFLQKNLSLLLRKMAFGNYLSILGVSLVFGLLHYAGGLNYILFATVSGVGYGWIYDRTKSIESAIIAHFGLNLIHFIFFTYPMLKSAL